MNFFNQTITKQKFMFIFLLMGIIYLFPFIITPYFFMDDNVRLWAGNPDWGWQGRPLSDLIFFILSSNNAKIYDLSPLPLIAGWLFFSGTVYYIINKHIETIKLIHVIPFLFILTNPFFVHNLLYKYDSLSMLLATSCAFLAYFYTSNNKYKSIIVPIGLLWSSLSLYQPCLNIYIALCVSGFIIKIKKEQNLKKEISLFIISIAIYFITVPLLLGLKTNRNHLIHFDSLSNVFSLVIKKLSFFATDLFMGLPWLIILPCLCLSVIFIFITIKKSIEENNNKYRMLYLVIPVVLYCSMWGGLILIKEPLIQPREFVVFSVLLFICSYFCFEKYQKTTTILTVVLLTGMYSFAYLTVNTFNQQKEFEKNIYQNVVTNVVNTPEVFNSYHIYINGRPPLSPVVKNTETHIPILKKIIEPSDKWVTRYTLLAMGMDNIKDGFSDDNKIQIEFIKDKSPIIETKFYNIYKMNNSAVLLFKQKNPKNNGVQKDSIKR